MTDSESDSLDEEIQNLLNEINGVGEDSLPEGVHRNSENPGRLKFDREVPLNAVGSRTVQTPFAIGNLSQLIIESGAKTKEEWVAKFLSGEFTVSMFKELRESFIQEVTKDKFQCAICKFNGAKGKGLARKSIDDHIKECHKAPMTPKYFRELAEILYNTFASITPEMCVAYLGDVVFNRTWDGHIGEKKVVEWIQKEIMEDPEIESPSDFCLKKTDAATDSSDLVDWYIECKDGDIGLQVKPEGSGGGMPLVPDSSAAKHEKWLAERGGKVLWPKYVGDQPARDSRLLDEIKAEISRLGGLKNNS